MPTLQVHQETIFYAQHGDASGVPIVFIHGAGGSHQSWLGALNLLQRCNAFALDLPAHGQSTGKGRDRIGDYADVVTGFLAALNLPAVVIAGTSLGGAVAQWMGLHYASRTRGLVLASTGAKLRVHPDILKAAKEGRPISSSAVLGGNPNQLSAPPPQNPTPPEVVHGDWVACDTFNVMERLGEIHCPTLVVVGEQDVMTPPKYAQYLAAHIKGAQYATIPGAGHSASREKPVEMAQAIQSFVDQL